MAGVEKYTSEAIAAMLLHNNRMRETYSNTDIDSSKSHLNYSFDMKHGELSDFDYYKKIVDESYVYGKGTNREKDTVMAFGWVVTLPKEIAGDPGKEKAFFKGIYTFVSRRYGEENILNNAIHYDEIGQPHIHLLVAARTKLDHEQVRHKTVKTKKTVKTESGRYMYQYKFKLDEAGQPIPLKNYAKMTDYYDYKFSANDVLNPIEMKHFHPDLQDFLEKQGIEGQVLNGATAGGNITVKSMKEFTKITGMTIDEAISAKENILFLKKEVASLKKELELTKQKTVTKTVNSERKWGASVGWDIEHTEEIKL